MADHARLSPSSRYRWRLCPASVRASEPYKGKSSPAAIDGTHTHSLLENCLRRGVVTDPSAAIGLLMHDKEGSFGVDKDRADRVRVATDYIKGQFEAYPDVKLISEKRVDPASLVGRDDMSGTADVQLFYANTVEIIDYKDGMNPVSPIGNEQLEQYAYGVIAEQMNAGNFNLEIVKMTIIQPKAALKGGPAISSAVVPVNELLAKLPRLVEEAVATDDPNAPFVPGEKQCQYCPARGNCKASAEHSLQQSGIKFDAPDLARAALPKEGEELTDERLREIIEAAPMLRKMIESAEEEALRRITTGHPVEGLKVIRGSGRRKWVADEEATAKKLKSMGVPESAIWEKVLISPTTALDKLKWLKKDGSEDELSDRQRKTLEKEWVAKSEGKLSVVPVADGRSAVEFGDLGKMFSPSETVQTSQPDWLS